MGLRKNWLKKHHVRRVHAVFFAIFTWSWLHFLRFSTTAKLKPTLMLHIQQSLLYTQHNHVDPGITRVFHVTLPYTPDWRIYKRHSKK